MVGDSVKDDVRIASPKIITDPLESSPQDELTNKVYESTGVRASTILSLLIMDRE